MDDINTEIRQGYFNVLILMRASPVVELCSIQASQDQQGETKAIGFPTRVASFYKYDVLKALRARRKNLYLKFEILTKANLIDSLQNGCRIMQLNCDVVKVGGVVLEDSIGQADLISYKELKEIFTPKQFQNLANLQPQTPQTTTGNNLIQQPAPQPQPNPYASEHFLELLILGAKNDFPTANFFADELKIPHVIYFQFLNKEFDFRHKMYEDNCIDKFSQFFLEDIIDGYSIRESFNRAHERTFDSLSERFFESRDNSYIKNIIGEGPMILPENSDHSEVFYGVEDFMLNDGKVEDISNVGHPTNITEKILPFTGRNNDIYAVAKLLVTSKHQFVKLIGEPGVGKTAFALQTGRFLLSRQLYPDGVFYFALRNLRNQQLKDMMKDTFGPKFENNMKHFFRDSKMLLIFDDFDIYYAKDQDFPRLIFLTLRECGIATLVITSSRKKQETITKKKWQQEYETEQKEIEDEFLRAERILKPMKDEEMAYVLLSMSKLDKSMNIDIEKIKSCQGIRQAEGNPRVLLNSLMDRKVMIDRRVLELNPIYLDQVHLDQSPNVSHHNTSTSHHNMSTTNAKLAKHNSYQGDSMKLTKMASTTSLKSPNSRDSLPSIKLNHRTKSSTIQGIPKRVSQEERKEKDKAFFPGAPSITEVQIEKSLEKPDGDEEIKTLKRMSSKSKVTATKLRREKSHGSNFEHGSELQKKDSSISEDKDKSSHNFASQDSNPMDYYYEEQKSNDADELLRELDSIDNERDELFAAIIDAQHVSKFHRFISNSDDGLEFEEPLDDDEEEDYNSDEREEEKEKEYSSQEESFSESLLEYEKYIERPSAGGRLEQLPDMTSRSRAKEITAKKKQQTNQSQTSDNASKKKNKGKKSGKQGE